MKIFKLKKLITGTLLAASILALNPIGASADWKQNSTGWWYTEGNSLTTGWRLIEGNWYYFYSDGYMAHDTIINGYYLNSSGAWTNNLPSANSESDFVFDEATGRIKAYIGSSSTVVIPSKINGVNVTSVGGFSPYNKNNYSQTNSSVSSVIISEGITSISSGAFWNCKNLTNITFPNSLTTIEGMAFAGCGLTSIIIPDGVTSIGTSSFSGCKELTSVTVPNSLTNIGSEALRYCDKSIFYVDNIDTKNLLKEKCWYIDDSKIKVNPSSIITMSTSASTSSSSANNSKTDTSKVLSSGMTLKQAKLKVDSVIAGIKALGDTAENNMDYINKLCTSMGTTYDEIKSFQG